MYHAEKFITDAAQDRGSTITLIWEPKVEVWLLKAVLYVGRDG